LPIVSNTQQQQGSKPILSCPSTVSFVGFGDEPNRGTLEMKYNKNCNNQNDNKEETAEPQSSTTSTKTTTTSTTTGRWLTKPSEIRKGRVQWSARWKVVGAGYIYKTDIYAQPLVDSIEAEMTKGVILDANNSGKVVGRFTGDLILMEDSGN